jgi:lipoate-protein ligase A
VIPEVLKLDGPTTMAAHEFLTTLPEPALMLSHFEPFTVTIGKGIHRDSLPDMCKSGEVSAVRRPTGGEVLPHDPSDLTFAFSCIPEGDKIDIMRAALLVKSWVMDGIDALGITTRSNLGTSILVPASFGRYRKIAGSAIQAQAEPEKPYLVHGSIFYNPDFDFLSRLYGRPREELQGFFTSVREYKDVSLQEVYRSIRNGFLLERNHFAKPFTGDEWAQIMDLAKKYEQREHLDGTGQERKGGLCAFTWGDHHDRLRHCPEKLKGRTIYDESSTKAI